jgi:hypothetical protein
MNENDVWYSHVRVWGSDGCEVRDYDLYEWDAQYFGRSCIHLQDVSGLKMIVAMSSGMSVTLGWTTRHCIPQLYVPPVVKCLHFAS